MRIFLLIFFISFGTFLNQNLNKMIIKFKSAFTLYNLCYDLLKDGIINVYYSEIYSSALESYVVNNTLFKIDNEKDEIIERTYLSSDTRIEAVKQLQNDIIVIITQQQTFYNVIFKNKETELNSIKGIYISYHHIVSTAYINDLLLVLLNLDVIYETSADPRPIILSIKYPYSPNYSTIPIDTYNGLSLHEKIIPLKDCFILLFYASNKNFYIFKYIDLDLNIINTQNITIEKYDEIAISEFSKTEFFNEFIVCFLIKSRVICKIIKYQNSNLIIGNDIEIFSNIGRPLDWLDKLWIYIFKENELNKLLFVCQNYQYIQFTYTSTLIITKATYINGKLQFDKNINQYSYIPNNLYINMNTKISTIMENHKGISIVYATSQYGFAKHYLNSACDSRTIYLEGNKFESFPIEEIVFKGIDKLYFFSFTNIDDNLEIFKLNKKINKNEIFSDTNNFTYILHINEPEKNMDNSYNLQVKMEEKNYLCDIEIKIKTFNIRFGDNYHKCLINEKLGRINDVYSNNLNSSFINEPNKDLVIQFTYYYLPKDEELQIYINKRLFQCNAYKNTVICSIPGILFKTIGKINIYSKLSCKNMINIG